MAETRHRTVLEIGVDDRQVRGLGASIDRTFSTNTIDAFERALARAARTLDALATNQAKMTSAMVRAEQQQRAMSARAAQDSQRAQQQGQGGAGGPPGGGGGGQPGFWNRTMSTAVGSAMGMGAAGARGSGAVSMAMGAIPIVGPVLSGAVQGMQGFYQSHVQRMMGRAAAFPATGIMPAEFGVAERMGARVGMMPGQSAAMMGQFAQQTGLTGEELMDIAVGGTSTRARRRRERVEAGLPMIAAEQAGAEEGPLAGRNIPILSLLGFQQSLGLRNAGSLVGAMGTGIMPGQGQDDPVSILSEAVRSGIQAGFREGRLDQFFSQMATWVEQMRTQGIPIEPSALLGMVRGVSSFGVGFEGEAGQAAARQFQGAIQNAGRGSGIGQFMMMRAAGLGQGRNYMEARAFAEQNPQEVMANFMEQYRAMTGGISGPVSAMFVEEAMRGLGMQMSATQALSFAQAAGEGAGGDFMAPASEAENQRTREYFQRRTRIGQQVYATPRAEAGYELQRANIGGQVASANRQIRQFEITLAQRFTPALGNFIADLTRAAERLASGDMVGAATQLTSAVGTEAIGETIGGAVHEFFNPTPEDEQRTTTRGIGSSGYGYNAAGERVPIPAPAAAGDDGPLSMIINGAEQIRMGAEGLRNRQLPGESDLTQAPA